VKALLRKTKARTLQALFEAMEGVPGVSLAVIGEELGFLGCAVLLTLAVGGWVVKGVRSATKPPG
jgi:hypothetical protein